MEMEVEVEVVEAGDMGDLGSPHGKLIIAPHSPSLDGRVTQAGAIQNSREAVVPASARLGGPERGAGEGRGTELELSGFPHPQRAG